MTEAGQDAGDRTARRSRWSRWRGDGTSGRAERTVDRTRAEQTAAWLDAWLSSSPRRTADALDMLEALRGEALVPTPRADPFGPVEAQGWTVLRDLHRPGRTRATVELVAVGPGGIVVIEHLRWDGPVQVVEGTLRHRGYGRTPDVAAVADTASAVTALLAPSHRRAVQAVACLVGQDLDPVAVCGGAVATGLAQLPGYLADLPERLPAAEVALVVDYLGAELGGPASPEQLTVDDVFRPTVVWDAPDVPHPHTPGPHPTAREPWPVDRLGEWPEVDGPRGPAPEQAPVQDATAYHQPENQHGAGSTPAPVPPVSPVPPVPPTTDAAEVRVPSWWARVLGTPRPGAGSADLTPDEDARGDGLLRSAVLVLGLLTVGNFVLAWLSARG
jgi:hypothetical protein